MRVISNDNHIVRKALNLSLVEMAVLCDIVQMSQNPKFDYWCVKSKQSIAEWVDISRDTVINSLSALEAKGLIHREINSLTKTPTGRIRPTQFVYDLDTAQEEIAIYIKNKEFELFSAKVHEIKSASEGVGNSDRGVGNSYGGVSEIPTLDKHNSNNNRERNKPPAVLSEESLKFSNWFQDNLAPQTLKKNLPESNRKKWQRAYDKLISMGYTKDQIVKACKWARQDSFWQQNFRSPAKLIEKNKEGEFYIDVLLEKSSMVNGVVVPEPSDFDKQYPKESDHKLPGYIYAPGTGKYHRPAKYNPEDHTA